MEKAQRKQQNYFKKFREKVYLWYRERLREVGRSQSREKKIEGKHKGEIFKGMHDI